MFDTLVEIDRDDQSWKTLNPAYIRAYLIKQLFNKNYSIDEILYLTGADLISISNLITYDEMVEKVKSRGKKVNKTHPFQQFLY